MRLLLTLILTLASTCFLQAENPSWRSGKRVYREAHCNYQAKCTSDFCSKNEPLSCECATELQETWLEELTKVIMRLYDVVVDEEKICKFVKKCYQYGYCPTCDCTREELNEVVEILLGEDKGL